jgi:hypothetical protein
MNIRNILGDKKANEFETSADKYTHKVGKIQHTFKDLIIGQSFDFMSDEESVVLPKRFCKKCTKSSAKSYTADGWIHEIISKDVTVYHVGRSD